jgi:preprotein translocase subunit SecG
MSTLITILHVLVCLFLMLTVLLQSGKGGGMGGAFGGSNAGTVFGGGGASNFLRRLTAGASTVFMLTSVVLAFLASHNTADALERSGEQQQSLADDKEKAKNKAIENGSKSGSGSAVHIGSAATMSPPTGPNLEVKPGTAPAGTGITLTPQNPAEKPDPTPAPGSAATPPAEKPTPAPAGSAATPPAAAKPAVPAPATPAPAKPATPTPAAATGSAK